MSSRTVSGGLGAGSATRSMKNLRNKPKVTDLIRDGVGYLTDLSGNHEVRLDWELNEQAVKDDVFRITIDSGTDTEKEVYIDLHELLFITRIIGMKG